MPYGLRFPERWIVAELTTATNLAHDPVVVPSHQDLDRILRILHRPPQRPYQLLRPECPPLPAAGIMDVGVHSANAAYPSRAWRICSSTSACLGRCGQFAMTVITPFDRTPIRMCVL